MGRLGRSWNGIFAQPGVNTRSVECLPPLPPHKHHRNLLSHHHHQCGSEDCLHFLLGSRFNATALVSEHASLAPFFKSSLAPFQVEEAKRLERRRQGSGCVGGKSCLSLSQYPPDKPQEHPGHKSLCGWARKEAHYIFFYWFDHNFHWMCLVSRCFGEGVNSTLGRIGCFMGQTVERAWAWVGRC